MAFIGAPTVRERIEFFLQTNPGRPFCDLCVGRELGVRSQGQISAVMGAIYRSNPACVRFRTHCCSCGNCRKSTRLELV